jgi:hypothetical protein
MFQDELLKLKKTKLDTNVKLIQSTPKSTASFMPIWIEHAPDVASDPT